LSNTNPSERWAFFDCFSGISGDMTLGAFIDLGLEVSELHQVFQLLGLGEIKLTSKRVTKEHLGGVLVEISGPDL